MSWISDGRGVEELSRKKSEEKIDASPVGQFYSSVGGESILRATDKAATSKIPDHGIAGRNIVDFFH
jgi:hypothetical protein